MSLVVNLFGGPGTGKSTTMAAVFAELKWKGITCEMAPEWVKGPVWEGRLGILANQIYIFGKQVHTIERLQGEVDVIITDAPILMSRVYGKDESPEFKALVLEVFNRYDNLNIFLKRKKAYDPKGRTQTEEEAKKLDMKIRLELEVASGQHYMTLPALPETAKQIAALVADML